MTLKSTKLEDICALSYPLDYYHVIDYQAKGCAGNRWPQSYEIDLNDDGKNEVFLGVMDYSRGMNYALFYCIVDNNNNEFWTLISDNDSIPSGHLGIEKLESNNLGWHDFIAYQPSGRGTIFKSLFSYVKGIYILINQTEDSLDS